jgi:hypothetical protein
VKLRAELHVVQLVGFTHVPYATYIVSFHASAGHTVFNITAVPVVYVASLLMVNDHIGAALSTINCPLVLVVTFVFHALSDIDHDSTHK